MENTDFLFHKESCVDFEYFGEYAGGVFELYCGDFIDDGDGNSTEETDAWVKDTIIAFVKKFTESGLTHGKIQAWKEGYLIDGYLFAEKNNAFEFAKTNGIEIDEIEHGQDVWFKGWWRKLILYGTDK